MKSEPHYAGIEGEAKKRAAELSKKYRDSVTSEFQSIVIKLSKLAQELANTYGMDVASMAVQDIIDLQVRFALTELLTQEGALHVLISMANNQSQKYIDTKMKQADKENTKQ